MKIHPKIHQKYISNQKIHRPATLDVCRLLLLKICEQMLTLLCLFGARTTICAHISNLCYRCQAVQTCMVCRWKSVMWRRSRAGLNLWNVHDQGRVTACENERVRKMNIQVRRHGERVKMILWNVHDQGRVMACENSRVRKINIRVRRRGARSKMRLWNVQGRVMA